MSKVDKSFLAIVKGCLNKGRWYKDESREDTHRLQIPSYTFRHSFEDGFPAVAAKELAWKSVVTELLWFLRGDSNIKYLVDNGNPIWNKDAYNWYKKVCKDNNLYTMSLKSFVLAIKAGDTMDELESLHSGRLKDGCTYKLGDVGQNYSKQWRSYAGQVDQVVDLIRAMKSNIMSTRLKVEAWNPAEIKKTALPPCHTGFQIIGVPLTDEERQKLADYSEEDWNDIVCQDLKLEALDHIETHGFELHWNQRSVDTFLGLPFNIGSYATLAKFLEAVTQYPALALQGDLKAVHLYDNSIDKSKALLGKDDSPKCDIKIDMPEGFENMGFDELINKLSHEDFKLVGYESYEASRVAMKAPKEV